MNDWEKNRREKLEKRVREIVAEYKCTQKTAYRIYYLEERNVILSERLGEVNMEIFELKYGPIAQYSHWDLGMVVPEDAE